MINYQLLFTNMIRPMGQNKSSSELTAQLRDCIARVANQRDKAAFAILFDHYAPLIRAYSLAREPGAELVADELTQEVMIRVWLKAGSYNSQLANINTWIFTLARNCRIDYLRRNGRFVSEIDPTEIFNDIEDESPSPFQLVHQTRLEDNIRTGLEKLPREQSDILIKVYLEGKSHQQTSEELKLPLGTVKSRVRLAIKKLKVLVAR
jgi:RNA polymerase sigma-70 factor (ECF subfamily)